ncbi:MAG: relaxase/mobilization nuclease domain-containing protein [Lachnospiraceae bacterium]|nr:relaxase/mobilization nuclease domain-containing protein [Lachnospiraceae bacterium]
MELIIKFCTKGQYKNKKATSKVIKYILRKNARRQKGYDIHGSIGTYHKTLNGIIDDFQKTKKLYHKEDGLQIKHLIISFDKRPGLNTTKLHKLILRTLEYFSRDYQVVYAVHEDTDHLHLHVGINSISYDGKKISITRHDLKEFTDRTKRLWKDIE